MAVRIGSARIDERGKARGGKAGDQSGKEVSTQAWYRHSKGWRVFRPLDPEVAERMARDMQAACDNPRIGYDQDQRDALYAAAKAVGFDCARVRKDVETDCSALVRVCAAYAGVKLPDFNTTDEAAALLRSGAFRELTGSAYTDSSARLRRGDVLVTRSKGHTVIVLSSGSKAGAAEDGWLLGERILRRGDSGPDVREMQRALIALGYSCGSCGADGDFGDGTERAVKAFQDASGLEADGEFGPKSLAALRKAQAGAGQLLVVTGETVYVRQGPGKNYRSLGVAKRGERLTWTGEPAENGWYPVLWHGAPAWVSGRYAKPAT